MRRRVGSGRPVIGRKRVLESRAPIMASRSICCARGLGENIDKVDDRFLTEPCCVVFKNSFVLGECDRINASLKTSLILVSIMIETYQREIQDS